MNKSVSEAVSQTRLSLVELTDDEIRNVSGARWKEEFAIVVPPPADPNAGGAASMFNAWWTNSPGGVLTEAGGANTTIIVLHEITLS